MKVSNKELLDLLQNLDASLKMQAITSDPTQNRAPIGPSVIELAANKIEMLLAEVEELKEENMRAQVIEIEAQKINLTEGDVLITTIKSDDVTMAAMNALSDQLRNMFSNNKVVVLGVGSEGDIKFTVAKDAASRDTKNSCGPSPTNYCSDCSCGKKEAFERKGE